MNICFCLDSLGAGGAERVASILANEFVKSDNKVTIILVSNDSVFYNLHKNVELVFIDAMHSRNKFKKIFQLRKTFKKIKPDVVISFFYHINIYTHLAIKGLGIRHIVSERNDPNNTKVNYLVKSLKNYIFRHASGSVFQTKDALKYYFPKDTRRGIIISNPIILKALPYNELERTKTIFTVGRLTKQKNTELLIKAFIKSDCFKQGYKLKIYGDGPLRPALESFSNKYNKQIFFEGISSTWQEKERKAALFVLPSNYEGMPNALMEALSLGIPCISTNCPVGGPASLIEHNKNGILIDINNENQLINAINTITNNPSIALSFSKNNTNYCERFSPTRIASAWLNFIKQILLN